jgi:hypothetical protein
MTRNFSLVAVAAIAGSLFLPAVVRAQTLTLLSAAAPSAASPGGVNVTVTASGFPSGAINPAQIQVTFTPVVSSSGPVVNTAAAAIETVYGTQSRVTFRVPSSLTFSTPVAYAITLSGPSFTSANSAQLTINPPPAIQSITPSYGVAGQNVSVAITGAFSDFTPGATSASFGPGITVNSFTATSSTTATAQLQIASGATLVSCTTNRLQ